MAEVNNKSTTQHNQSSMMRKSTARHNESQAAAPDRVSDLYTLNADEDADTVTQKSNITKA